MYIQKFNFGGNNSPGYWSSKQPIEAKERGDVPLDFVYRSLAFDEKYYSPVRHVDVQKVRNDYRRLRNDFADGLYDVMNLSEGRHRQISDHDGCDFSEAPICFFGRLVSWILMTRDEWEEQQKAGLACRQFLSARYGFDAINSAYEVQGIKRKEDQRVTTRDLRKIYDHIDGVLNHNLALAERWISRAVNKPLEWSDVRYQWCGDEDYFAGDCLSKVLSEHEISALKGAILDDLSYENVLRKMQVEEGEVEKFVRPYFEQRLKWLDESKYQFLKSTIGGITYRLPGEPLCKVVKRRFANIKVSNPDLIKIQKKFLGLLKRVSLLNTQFASPFRKECKVGLLASECQSVLRSCKKLKALFAKMKDGMGLRERAEREHVLELTRRIAEDVKLMRQELYV